MLIQVSGFINLNIIKPAAPQQVLKLSNPASDERMTYYTVSLFIEQKLRQNTEAVCEKLSEPLIQQLQQQ